MEELIDLVQVLSKNKIKRIDVIGNNNVHNSQVQQLYDGIYMGRIKNDEDVINHFFSNANNAALYCSRLKRQLVDRIVNTLFFIDVNQNNFNEYNRAYYTSYKLAAATRILLGRNTPNAAALIAEKALHTALEFELTDVAFLLARDLQMYYGAIKGSREKFLKMGTLLDQQWEILQAELKAERYMTDLKINFVNTKAVKSEFTLVATRYAEELKQLSTKINSYRFNYMSYLTQVTRFEVAGDYKNMLPVCQEALQYFRTKEHMVPVNALFSFFLRKLICYIQLRNYEAAKKTVPECLQYSREGTNNWFLTLDYQLVLAFHSLDFQAAYAVCQIVLNHSQLKHQRQEVTERWLIHEAYIYYLISIKKIKIDDDNPVKKFRISKFVNEVPVYQKDKRGMNISILILQILFLLKDKKYGEIIDRTDSLKAYTQRYLRQDDTFRSNCFIQMLLTLPECSFHKKAVLRKAEKYWKKLQEVPLNIANQSAEIEIVPYETLWGFVLESLDEKWH
jgi:hypothetical protein